MFNHRGERILEGVCEGRFPEPRKPKMVILINNQIDEHRSIFI